MGVPHVTVDGAAGRDEIATRRECGDLDPTRLIEIRDDGSGHEVEAVALFGFVATTGGVPSGLRSTRGHGPSPVVVGGGRRLGGVVQARMDASGPAGTTG